MALDATELMILIKATDQASGVIRQVEQSSTSLGNVFTKVSQNALGVAAGIAALAGAGSAMQALSGVVVGFNSKIEQSTIAWTTFTGSADAARGIIQQIQQIAAITPFEFKDVDNAAKRFVNAGFSAQEALSFITPLSNAVASVGLNAEGVDRVSLALAQMTQKTRVQGQEMLQLTEAQIPAWDILAQATGKPIPELQKLVTEGRISAKEFTDAFSVFYGETGKFANAAHDQSLTFQGSMSTIRDELNIVGSTAFKPLFDALSTGARAFAAFVQSDAFTVWGAKIQAVVGFVVDGLGGLAGAFSSTLGGVLDVVNTLGQAIYAGLQWINPFASHSPPLVSQVQDGVAAIQASYESLGGLTATFEGIGGAFDALTVATDAFSGTVDGMASKTERALAVMGPGVSAAFSEASSAIDTAKGSLAEIKTAWDDATAALDPLKANLEATKDALKTQQFTLSDLRTSLSDAKASFDPLNQALKDAEQNAKDAESAIKDLTNAPIAGSAEFEKKISDGNIALKEQELVLSRLKHGDTFASLGTQIDAAAAKLKDMQRAQTLQAGPTSDAARAAIAAQQVALDVLKSKQTDLLEPAQKELDKRRDLLDTLRLEKDATIGVAQERIKSAAAAALGVKEQTEAQIKGAIEAARIAKDLAAGQAVTLSPQVKAQQDAMDGLSVKIRDQEKAVRIAQQATDAANTTYTDAKAKVDDLGTAYRDSKAQIAAYEQQLKTTIAAGDMQVQKLNEAKKAANDLAKAAGSGAVVPKTDVLAGLDIEGSKAKIKAFSDQVAATRGQIETNLSLLSAKWAFVWFNVVTAIDKVLARFGGFKTLQPAMDFLARFAGAAAGLGAALIVATPIIGLFGAALAPVGALIAAALTPIGLLILGISTLTAAWTLNVGNIQEKASSLAQAFVPLQLLPTIIEKALGGDVVGALIEFVDVLSATRAGIIEELARWAGSFVDWLLPQLPALTAQLTTFASAIIGWILGQGDKFLTQLLKWGTAFVDWIEPRIPAILAALSGLGLQILQWIRDQGTLIATRLAQWEAAFIKWVIPLLPKIGTALTQVASAVIDFIRTAVPIILGALADWAGAFVKWVVPLIPDLLGALLDLVAQITVWIVEVGLPKIVDVLVEWGAAFIGWIGPNIAPMIVEAVKLLDRLAAWIIEKAPEVAEKLLQWGAAFVGWITTEVLPKLGPALDFIINGGGGWEGFAAWIPRQVIALAGLLGAWAAAFVNWITDPGGALTALTVELPKIVNAINDWIIASETQISQTGQDIATAMIKGLVQGLSDLPGAIGPVLVAAWEEAKSSFLRNLNPIGGSGAAAPSVSNIPVSSDALTNPLKLGGQNGPGTIPQIVGGFLTSQGMTADQIAAFCGPLAAEAIATGLGKGVDIPTLVRKALNAGWTAAAGQGGFISFQRMLDSLGVPSIIVSAKEAINQLAKGIPVAISTPLHYFLATGLDAAGKLIVGESGKVFRGGAAALTLDAISSLGGAIQAFITPAFQDGGDAIAAFGGQLATANAPIDNLSAAAVGLGGDLGVFATRATVAGQTVADAISAVGDNKAWQTIDSNAAIAGQSLIDYLQNSGAGAIDTAAASLADLEKASGLTLPQIQQQAEAAGKDIKTWLEDTGVPSAMALAKSLGVGGGVAGAAAGLKKPISEATSVTDDLGGKMGEVATNQATQIAAVLLDLRDGLLGINKHAEGGLIQAVKDFAAALVAIPTDVKVNITTQLNRVASATPAQFAQSGISEGSNRSANISPFPDHIGESGPGGIYNDPSTGKPYTRAGGGPVSAGHLYRVNEAGAHGVELFMPAMNGAISPRSGGGSSWSGGGSNEDRLAEKFATAMMRAMRSSPPRVAVEDIRSSLIKIGQANGGVVGLA